MTQESGEVSTLVSSITGLCFFGDQNVRHQ